MLFTPLMCFSFVNATINENIFTLPGYLNQPTRIQVMRITAELVRSYSEMFTELSATQGLDDSLAEEEVDAPRRIINEPPGIENLMSAWQSKQQVLANVCVEYNRTAYSWTLDFNEMAHIYMLKTDVLRMALFGTPRVESRTWTTPSTSNTEFI